MSYFVIAGMPECCMFNHVRVISDILSDRFPNFKASFIQLEPEEWKTWIKEKNLKHGWYHLSSPIVWKELTLRAGKPHLIGGASEFWEYCYDYYNLECFLPKKELCKIVEDFKQYNVCRKQNEAKREAKEEKMIICIASNQIRCGILNFLIIRLITRIKKFGKKKVIIRIYQHGNLEDDLLDLQVFEVLIEIVANLNQGLKNADLLIIVGDYTRLKDEDVYYWLYRNKLEMETIADYINDNAKQSLRVIVGVNGPVCFNVAILLENVTKIHLYNIVAETASMGLEHLNLVSKITGMALEDMSGPPIWGFIGINQIVNLEHIIQRYDVYRPNTRAVKNNYGSTLELGKRHTELRFLNYLPDKLKSVWIKLKNKQDDRKYSHNRYAKSRGITTLIDNWYFPEYSGNIISLGILSNGTFNIPSGIVFSQPVILKNDRWIPMKMFPIPRKDPCCIDDLIPFIVDIYRYFKIREDILPEKQ